MANRPISYDAAREAVAKSMMSVAEIADLVGAWCEKAGGAALDPSAATEIAKIIKDAAGNPGWRNDARSILDADRDAQRIRRIVEALRILNRDLPPFLELVARGSMKSPVSWSETLKLRDLVDRHQPLIDAVQPRGRGAVQSGELVLAIYIAQIAQASGKLGAGVADAVAAEALKWLTGRPAGISSEAIRKGRGRHRT